MKNVITLTVGFAVLMSVVNPVFAQGKPAETTQEFGASSFSWVEGKGCYATDTSTKKPELLEGVDKKGCNQVVPVRDLTVKVTADPNGSGYIATFESPQTGKTTCWYADDKAVACQDHVKKAQ